MLKAVELETKTARRTEMQTYQITVTAGSTSQTFEINLSDSSFCELVQQAGMTDPERHDEAVCSAAVDKVIELFASLD
jgi:hypothetical protein